MLFFHALFSSSSRRSHTIILLGDTPCLVMRLAMMARTTAGDVAKNEFRQLTLIPMRVQALIDGIKTGQGFSAPLASLDNRASTMLWVASSCAWPRLFPLLSMLSSR